MNLRETMATLEKLGDPQTKQTWARHGSTGEFFGVKIGHMKTLLKKIKGQQQLALDLYATGNLDAMYLAGLVADGARMTKPQVESWLQAARSPVLSEYTVPWVASESEHARALAMKWIDSPKEHVASAGWNTYSGLVATRPDSELDSKEIAGLLQRIEKEIGKAKNRVRYCMNGFVIAVGASVPALLAKAKATAKKLGKVEVEMGDTACKVPPALARIEKIEAMGRVGKKRKSVKC